MWIERVRGLLACAVADLGGLVAALLFRAADMKAVTLGILAKAIFFLPAFAVLCIVFFGGIFHRVPPTANYPHWLN